nr:hypothetical protein N-4 - Chlamydia trachomatis plasmid pLGV440 [Chlamydia trachomatis]
MAISIHLSIANSIFFQFLVQMYRFILKIYARLLTLTFKNKFSGQELSLVNFRLFFAAAVITQSINV